MQHGRQHGTPGVNDHCCTKWPLSVQQKNLYCPEGSLHAAQPIKGSLHKQEHASNSHRQGLSLLQARPCIRHHSIPHSSAA